MFSAREITHSSDKLTTSLKLWLNLPAFPVSAPCMNEIVLPKLTIYSLQKLRYFCEYVCSWQNTNSTHFSYNFFHFTTFCGNDIFSGSLSISTEILLTFKAELSATALELRPIIWPGWLVFGLSYVWVLFSVMNLIMMKNIMSSSKFSKNIFEKFELWSFFCLHTPAFKMKSPNLDQGTARQIRRQIQTWTSWMQRWWIS